MGDIAIYTTSWCRSCGNAEASFDTHVGGFDDLLALHRAGRVDERLQTAV